MTILRSLPARNLRDVHDEVNRLFDGLVAPAGRVADAVQPMAVDVHESDAGYTLQFDLPGIKPEDVKVRIHDAVLTVSAERAANPPAGEGVRTNRSERVHGAFSRSFTLRRPVDTSGITATVQEGVLTLFVPRAEEAKPRDIKIDVVK
jgi:HSP20 family protein